MQDAVHPQTKTLFSPTPDPVYIRHMASKKKSKKKPARRPAAKKATKKKPSRKKTAKKTTARKSSARKSTAKKGTAKKGTAKKAKKKAKKKAVSRVGRPPLPKKELRSNVFCVRLKDDERKLLDKAAAKKGVSTTDWAIQKLLKGL